jgi:hypothetical protein
MKHVFTKGLLVLLISFIAIPLFSQTAEESTLSREELAIKNAEAKLEAKRLKLVTIKIDIESADSLMDAGEKLREESQIAKAEAREEVKEVEREYKSESKPFKKEMKSKDKEEATQAKADLKELTTKYKIDLKAAQNKVKAAEKNILASERMMDKADKKLDILAKKLKVAEGYYDDAEKALNKKKEGKK